MVIHVFVLFPLPSQESKSNKTNTTTTKKKYVSNKDWDTNTCSLHFVSDSNLQEKLVQ